MRRTLLVLAAVVVAGLLFQKCATGFIRYGLYSKTTEAKVILGGIKTTQEAFRAEYGFYVAAGPMPPRMTSWTVKDAWEDEPCPQTCSHDDPRFCNRFYCLGYEPAGQVYYQYSCTTTGSAATANFTCAARGDLDGDGEFGMFVYGTNRGSDDPFVVAPVPAMGSRHSCEAQRPLANEVVDCSLKIPWWRWLFDTSIAY